jgi:tRNA wybutosine-synthesizing protein 4
MNVSMWLHYDVMANVLFHVTSHPRPVPKYLILFPPSDIRHLDFPPGSTTSTLELFPTLPPAETPTSPTTPKASTADPFSDAVYPPNTHPHLVTLPPNTALFIPPLWSHAAVPSPPGIINTSINVFFYSLPRSTYAAGRDVYGNRDLAAYEEGRRDVEKIVRRFKVVPGSKNAATATSRKHVVEEPNGSITSGGEVSVKGKEKEGVAVRGIDGIPKDVAKAYLERLAGEILEKAAAL